MCKNNRLRGETPMRTGFYGCVSEPDGRLVLLLSPRAGSVTTSELDTGSILSRSNHLVWVTAFLKTFGTASELSCSRHLVGGNWEGV